MKMGQAVRGLMPPGAARQGARARTQARLAHAPARAQGAHARRLRKPSMMPGINTATARVLDAAGIQTVVAREAGCCGAVKFHLNDQEGGLAQMRANIDAWWPWVEKGEVEAIVMNASGCGVTVKEYGHLLQHDRSTPTRPRRISALTRDLSELLPDITPACRSACAASRRAPRRAGLPPALHAAARPTAAGTVEEHLRALGFDVRLPQESHLCCGSAGTYRCCRPRCRSNCASASSATWASWRRRSSSRPTSAASPTCKAAPIRPCATGFRCWTMRLRAAQPISEMIAGLFSCKPCLP